MTTPDAAAGRDGAAQWAAIAAAPFARLTTFKRNGDPVSSAMWLAPLGDDIVMSTPADMVKVKRLRRDARVELAISNRMGTVEDGAAVVTGRGVVLSDPADVANGTRAILGKYGLQWRAMKAVEWVAARGRSRDRVVLRLTRDA